MVHFLFLSSHAIFIVCHFWVEFNIFGIFHIHCKDSQLQDVYMSILYIQFISYQSTMTEHYMQKYTELSRGRRLIILRLDISRKQLHPKEIDFGSDCIQNKGGPQRSNLTTDGKLNPLDRAVFILSYGFQLLFSLNMFKVCNGQKCFTTSVNINPD